ncbi:LIM domain-containing protein [Metarhizium album ARSEF 1941]|uniref:LIM domain-containing protein n=1 Tax=Metarhizium album (strain ARSEF 1941) TaxID=1081103 RepID=A0A0B2WZC5_METAS|nr:LIM domain-containing protein [Metarhizium album ARSEF 1941]KHN99388.1 LIM domain-containing protein [Metarhizium album ARSEF 1941]
MFNMWLPGGNFHDGRSYLRRPNNSQRICSPQTGGITDWLPGQTYVHRGQLTPVSQPSGSREASPIYTSKRENFRKAHENFGSRKPVDVGLESPTSFNPAARSRGYGGFEETSRENVDKPLSGGFMNRLNVSVPGPFDPARGPSTAQSPYHQQKNSIEKLGLSKEPLLPRHPRKDGYGGFGAPKNATSNDLAGFGRSETYPKLSPTKNSFQTQRTPSAPASPPERSRIGVDYEHAYKKRSLGPDTSRKPPPRTSLLPEHSLRNKGSVDLAAEFGIGNPYHSSSDSVSSRYSDFSRTSRSTALTSPARSETCPAEQSRETNEGGFPTDRLKSNDSRIDPFVGAPQNTQFDGASRSRNKSREPISRGGYSSSPPQDGNYMPPDLRNNHARTGSTSSRRQGIRERHATPNPLELPSRGDCKACRLPIRGKSISSADGRLTGKYHKSCFICTTCAEPFPSSVFYVLDDKPYCKQHYHELNGSLCGQCRRGIEGQYLEDEARVKYHVGCFRCLDCGQSLSEGYFEIGGSSYCEKDAWKRVEQVLKPLPPEPEPYQRRPSRGVDGTRIPQGLPFNPAPRFGQGPPPPPPSGLPNGGRSGAGASQPFGMNKRMTRLGNMNLGRHMI